MKRNREDKELVSLSKKQKIECWKPKVDSSLLEAVYFIDFYKFDLTYNLKFISSLYHKSIENDQLSELQVNSLSKELEEEFHDNVLGKGYYGKKEVLSKPADIVKVYQLIWWNFNLDKTTCESDVLIQFSNKEL